MRTSLLLEMATSSSPDRIAITGSRNSLTFQELSLLSQAVADWAKEQPGDKLVFLGVNDWIFPTIVFASGLAGKPLVPLNYRLPDAELNNLLDRTAPSVAIVDDEMIHRVSPREDVVLFTRSDAEHMCENLTNEQALVRDSEEEDKALLLFTSGTTGEPKTAVLRHAHLTSYVISTVELMSAEEDEASLVSVPPYHIAGVSAVLTGIYGGRRIVYLPEFQAEDWVDKTVHEKITHAMVVPTMLSRILDVLEARGETLPFLKALSYGGGRMPQTVIERALELLPHVDFINAYGLTETSSTIAILDPDDHRKAVASEDPKIRQRLGSVGRPLPTLELEIRGPEGQVLSNRESGEVFVRGDQVAGEYLHKRAILDDGWFPTNDAGWLDEDGYLYIEGRLDDVIVRGGENISPGEIEDVLRQHPDIADVAVIGVPDAQWGENVAAVIVPKSEAIDTHELSCWVKSRLRSTKTPQHWVVRKELPYNETGKLLRRVLKAEMTV